MSESPAMTSPDKVLWHEDRLTKKDLIDYYRDVAELLLAELKDRLLTLVRAPDGIEGEVFFQKNAPRYTPDWIKTVRVPAPSAKRDISYIVCNSLNTLLWVGNQAGIELHPTLDRSSKPGRPDLLVFDMDPPQGRFDLAVEGALLLRGRLADLGLNPCIKTTGGKGLHVYVRLERRYDFSEVHSFAVKVGQAAVKSADGLLTLEFLKVDRAGRVFVDVHRNGPGATLVAPFSPRARSGAAVSFPVTWDEIGTISPSDFTIKNARGLLKSKGVQEWKASLKNSQRLPKLRP